MRERSLPVRNVQNVSEAIELAEQFHANGLVDLYRGQSGDWPISTTIQRINSGEQQCEAVRTDAFVSWIMATPELSSLHWDEDAILAVAQHYGIATPFLDVSVSARVAAYFAATDAPSNVGQSSHGMISGPPTDARQSLLYGTKKASLSHAPKPLFEGARASLFAPCRGLYFWSIPPDVLFDDVNKRPDSRTMRATANGDKIDCSKNFRLNERT